MPGGRGGKEREGGRLITGMRERLPEILDPKTPVPEDYL